MVIEVKCVGCPYTGLISSAVQPFCPRCGSILVGSEGTRQRFGNSEELEEMS